MARTRSRTSNRRGKKAALIFFTGLLTLATVAGLGAYWALLPTADDAQQAFDDGDLANADKIIKRVLKRDDSPATLFLAALIAREAANAEQSEELLGRIEFEREREPTDETLDLMFRVGRMWGELGRMGRAEEHFRQVLASNPRHLEANERLLDLLRMQGRNWEAHQFAANVFSQQKFNLETLQQVGTLEAVWVSASRDFDFLDFCESIDPDSPYPQMGPIRLMLARNENVEFARERLTALAASSPHLIEIQAMYGELLFETGTDEEFLRWHAKLPRGTDRHPNIWVLRARWAQRHHDPDGAIRCLWEAIKRFPNDRAANFQMARLLTSIGREEDAEPFQRRGDLLLKFDNELLRGQGTNESIVVMIETLEKLDRRWEAIGWAKTLLGVLPSSKFANDAVRRISATVNPYTPLTPDSANPALGIDLSRYPIPKLPIPGDSKGDGPVAGETSIAYRDEAKQRGIDFQFFVDAPRMKSRVYTFDFAGGGAGVLDFDGNGWPDLYLTQGRHWPSEDLAAEPKNGLFWNQGDRFVDIANLAGVADQQFGHGTAVGDFNADGFDDLYVANIGGNLLFLNNGDGTFANVTLPSGTAGDDFSLSAAAADFNGDQLPDLYVVNYLGGDALELQCEIGGRPTQCSPLDFPGQADRLYVNQGDGTFLEISSDAGIALPEGPGKGMGVLVADFDGQNGLDIYVTNDTMANRLYLNQGGEPGELRFVEQGRASGVAYDARGRLQGSMGIAAADVNNDSMFDIFVTNYWKERNNYFSQIAAEPQPLFNDAVLETNLAVPSIPEVGWGTQFLDADLDGDWDLFVANGHVDEYTGPPDARQRPQMFENSGQSTFAARPQSGPYFERLLFGRAAVTWDWNRDGLPDLCVTHRGDPVALLTNGSERQGRFLAVELRGVISPRDACGAVVEVEFGVEDQKGARTNQRRSVHLTAGHGFSGTNQRQVLLGLGQSEANVTLRVRWPSGSVQEFADVAVDSRWLVVEGSERPLPLPE